MNGTMMGLLKGSVVAYGMLNQKRAMRVRAVSVTKRFPPEDELIGVGFGGRFSIA